MPRLALLFFLYIFIGMGNSAIAQQTKDSISGEYFMVGVTEMASVIWLKPDGNFEFFFSYGALDRTGTGKWTLEGKNLTLNSGTRPPKDFAIVRTDTMAIPGTIVKVSDKNNMLLSYIQVKAHTPEGIIEGKANSHGEFQIRSKSVSRVELLFELCPDRYSSFTLEPGKNFFEFRFEPWIANLFLSNLRLTISDNILTGQHPLMEGQSFRYVRGTR